MLYSDIGKDIWEKKYRYNNESFDEWIIRVSGGNDRLADLIRQNKFLFAGRILANRGIPGKLTYSNCYVISPPDDNIESIWDTAKKAARTYSYGGGCGIDLSNLAPKGAVINNSSKETSGVVSFMDLYNLTTDLIGQNGRRGAMMMSLSCEHPDIEEFITVKSDLKKINKANISVRFTDDFMDAVVNDKEFTLSYYRPESGQNIERIISAKRLFKKFCKMNHEYAEPGAIFWDRVKSHTMLSNYDEFSFAGLNPCGEQPLPAGGSCLLGAINLSEFVDSKGIFDFVDFSNTIVLAVEALNDVLMEGLPKHPLDEQKESVNNWRQIGLGIMGVADMLIKMGMKYGSDEAVEMCDYIMNYMINKAITTSALIAYTQGTYPKFNYESWSKSKFVKENINKYVKNLVKKYGLANSQILTVAPTGSISTMLGISGGIEPIFATHYTRKTESLHGEDKYYKVYTPIVQEYIDKHRGNAQTPRNDYIITAPEIEPINRIKMQSVFQKYIDASISSTVNLPEDTSVDDIMNIYIEAWKAGLKGITIYRDGCKRDGILVKEKKKPTCPDCGTEIEHTGGCVSCPECGFGLCSL